jgi:hypothetical protein
MSYVQAETPSQSSYQESVLMVSPSLSVFVSAVVDAALELKSLQAGLLPTVHRAITIFGNYEQTPF